MLLPSFPKGRLDHDPGHQQRRHVGAPDHCSAAGRRRHALDAIEAGIRLIEADPSVRTVGRGGWPNLLCEMELDACMMDGTTLRSGAVGALQGTCTRSAWRARSCAGCRTSCWWGRGRPASPVKSVPKPADNLIEDSRRAWQDWFDNEVPDEQSTTGRTRRWRNSVATRSIRKLAGDTTVFLAQDSGGNICSGASTSGWGWKYPGRLGDSPIVGAGSYADTVTAPRPARGRAR